MRKGALSRMFLRSAAIAILSLLCYTSFAVAAEKWPGVDESVVEKYAKEQGREAHEPLINTDQGDLLLFVFLVAGAIGGFVAGYYWRVLITEKAKVPTDERHQPVQGSPANTARTMDR